ncbi:TBC1 domain family member 25 [Aplochiton taeniatus]
MAGEEERGVVRVKVKKCDGVQPVEFRSFAVDPQITSLEVLQHILIRAFDLNGKRNFGISYLSQECGGVDSYQSLLSDSDLDAAFVSAAKPHLQLKMDIRPSEDSPLMEDWDIISPKDVIGSDQLSGERRSLASAALPFTQSLLSQMGKTLSKVQQALTWSYGEEVKPFKPPLSDTEFHHYLNGQGQLSRPEDLRLRIYHGGVEPSLRKVVWRYLLNVYPDGLTGQERMDYMKRKTREYDQLKGEWTSKVNSEDLDFIRGNVLKDVLRTDRAHPYYAGSEDSPHLTALTDLLTTFAITHPQISYCQGMSDIASPILAVMDNEAHAFICFCGIMKRLEGNFRPDGQLMSVKFQHLKLLLQYSDPEFYSYLVSRGADDLFFCYRWLLLELKREFAFDDALRMLEVTWSSLPPDPPETEVELLGPPLEAEMEDAPSGRDSADEEEEEEEEEEEALKEKQRRRYMLRPSREQPDGEKQRNMEEGQDEGPVRKEDMAYSEREPVRKGDMAYSEREPGRKGDMAYSEREPVRKGDMAYSEREPGRKGDMAYSEREPVRKGDMAYSEKEPVRKGEGDGETHDSVRDQDNTPVPLFIKQSSFGEFKYYSARNEDSFDMEESSLGKAPSRPVSLLPARQSTEESEEDPGERAPLINNQDKHLPISPLEDVKHLHISPLEDVKHLPISPLEDVKHLHISPLEDVKSPASLIPAPPPGWKSSSSPSPTSSLSPSSWPGPSPDSSPSEPAARRETARGPMSSSSPGLNGRGSSSPCSPPGRCPHLSSPPPGRCPHLSSPPPAISSPVLSFGRGHSSPSNKPVSSNLPSPCSKAYSSPANTPNYPKAESPSLKPCSLPPPQEFGRGNPFMLFLCLSILLEHRDHIVKNSLDYNELAMHFDRLVRRHNLGRVLQRAKSLFADYLQSEVWDSEEGDEASSDSPTTISTAALQSPTATARHLFSPLASPHPSSPNSTYNLTSTIPSSPNSTYNLTSTIPSSPNSTYNLTSTIPSSPNSTYNLTSTIPSSPNSTYNLTSTIPPSPNSTYNLTSTIPSPHPSSPNSTYNLASTIPSPRTDFPLSSSSSFSS